MKRILTYLFLIIIVFIIQSTFINKIAIAGIIPNLCIVLVISAAFFNGSSFGALVGFLLGLLIDIFCGSYLGLFALIYASLGYGVGFTYRAYIDFDVRIPCLLIFTSDFLYGIIVYLCFYLINNDFSFINYLGKIILPEAIYSLCIGLILYRIVFAIDQKLKIDERKADGYFVS